MNILFISSIQMWGGGEVFLIDLMRGLKKRGHSVSLLCRPKTELAQNAAREGFDVTTMRIGGDFDPLVIWKAYQVMRRKKIQAICTNMDKDLRFGGLAAKLAGVPRIIPSREIDYPLKDTLRYRFFYNSIATRIVMNSKATLQTVTESAPWFNRSRAIIIYKGIDLRPYDKKTASTVRQDLAIKKSSPIVTFVGQLDERKGIHYLLDAWRLVTKHHPKAVLLMAGKGKMVDFIRRYIKGFSLESSIVLAGFRADIPALLRDSSMLVLPSLWEGFGYVLVEAMAASLPTVATKTSSIPEIVIDGETGILVPPKESRPLAKAIDTLLDSPKMRKKMGRAGRRVVEEKFTIDRMVDDFERIFRE